MSEPRITGPLFKWFGSKWMSAKRYPMPIHDTIYESCAGGAGFSLRHFQKNVVLFDTDPNLSLLWPWLIRIADYHQVKAIPVGVPIGTDILSLDLSIEQATLLKLWQRTNNVGNCWTISSWGSLPGQWTESTRERVAREIELIKHWKFEPINWKLVATYFVDPPYLYNYRYRQAFDHEWLCSKLRGLPPGAQLIACEAVCQKTGSIPTYLPFVASHSQVTSRRKSTNNHHSKELIYSSVIP